MSSTPTPANRATAPIPSGSAPHPRTPARSSNYLYPSHPLLTAKRARSLRARVARLTSSHFTIVMGTSIVGSLLIDIPWGDRHPQPALVAIAAAFYIVSAILFTAFAILSILRYIWFPEIWRVMIAHETYSLFLGCIPMGFVTIVSGLATLSVFYGWSSAVLLFASGLWWLALVQSALTAFGVPLAMFSLQLQRLESMTATWLLPVVPTITVASVGSTIARCLIPINPSYALTIVLTSYVSLGIGLLLSVLILAAYFLRLAVHHLPPRQVIISTFLPLGPCGQGGYALIELGRIARDLFPILKSSYGPTEGGEAVQAFQGAAEAMYGTGLVWGFLLWGLGIWWLFLAVASVSTALFRQAIRFNMGFWAFTFPLGSMTLLTLSLGTAFSSPFFQGVGTAFTAAVIVLWAVCFVPTLHGWWRGSLFEAPCLSKLPEFVEDEAANDDIEVGAMGTRSSGSGGAQIADHAVNREDAEPTFADDRRQGNKGTESRDAA